MAHSDYQVIARKFRPQTFKDVMGQEAIVTTLKNAMKFNRLAQAYLFCGSRGTGKTTLARLFAKALNCQHLTDEGEPCNQCSSCREITSGSSLDVLEIDGASHRGIEDIRQINDTVGYTAASGQYKIYIIDEVHMLTKEAFNALLKTLEEPPPKVKFFFATTEPYKVLPTILSRCQRFNLNRIPLPQIVVKLRHIAHQLKVEVEEEALRLVAQRAEGGLRDAESLFDQILAFQEGPVTVASVASILGLMPRDIYFEIDQAGKKGEFAKAFEITQRVFSEGKDLTYFMEGLIDHLRQILLFKLSGRHSPLLTLTESEKDQYERTALLYTQEQCLDLIEYLLEAQGQLRLSSFGKISLEAILLHVMRSHFRLSIEQLVYRLSELEQSVHSKQEPIPSGPSKAPQNIAYSPPPPQVKNVMPSVTPAAAHVVAAVIEPPAKPVVSPASPLAKPPSGPALGLFDSFVSVDPTPTPADLGKAHQATPQAKPKPAPQSPPQKMAIPAPAASVDNTEKKRPLHQYDTLLHFAAVELDGRLQKN